ncbi:MAG TPA: hypothetical protein VNM67_12065 [Thermoanaerobaculia bacterium]|jgi:hypothetical protein|nr:hypothetical protein [Thermoanaerobaculia bacterium]
MNRLRVFLLVCLALTLVAGPALAKENPADAKQTRIVKGYFDCDGNKTSFSLPEGGGLSMKRRDGTAEYRLVPEKLDNNRVSLALIDTVSGQPVERFDASLDGKLVRGANLSLALTGITVERTVPKRRVEAAVAASESDPQAGNACCIGCGDWIVCCEVSGGWCCDLECSSGGGCSVCSPMEQ